MARKLDAASLARRFPRADKYALEWIREGAMGSHPLWMAEWLCERLALAPGLRVLDLGCGKAKSSIFLAREFGVEVWATDLWIAASENWRRVRDAGLEDRVFPLHADARALPFAAEFFDVVTAFDCFSYFGTDDLYLNYLVQFVKPGGRIAVAGSGLTRELPAEIPEHLREMWTQDFFCLHSAAWWRRHWERTGLVDLEVADEMEDGFKVWSHWQRTAWPDNKLEYETVEQDAGRYLGYVRMIGRRRPGAQLAEYAWPDALRSFPEQYEKKPLLRS